MDTPENKMPRAPKVFGGEDIKMETTHRGRQLQRNDEHRQR